MNLQVKIDILDQLGKRILSGIDSPKYKSVIEKTYLHNPWFTAENSVLSLKNIAAKFFAKNKLEEWLDKYTVKEPKNPKKIGLILAGNIPLVGFHDILCVFLTGNQTLYKMSSKDKILASFILEGLAEIDPATSDFFISVEMLKTADAVIATGSDNSARYFEYYFRNKPHIIRKNRSSVAILTGKETENDIKNLAKDIFTYFGSGCRNVSKIYIPENYLVETIFPGLEDFSYLFNHFKYSNNYNYQKTILLMNQTPHFDNGFVLIKEDQAIVSPLSMLYYEKYSSFDELRSKLTEKRDKIQVIAGNKDSGLAEVEFGKTQEPELWDYTDKIDTLDFLINLADH